MTPAIQTSTNSIMDKPENQELLLLYCRRHGKHAGFAWTIGISEQTVFRYLDDHPDLAKRVEEAKQQRDLSVDDLQTFWNRNLEANNTILANRIVEILSRGLATREITLTQEPIWDETTGDYKRDAMGEIQYKTIRRQDKTKYEPAPEYIMRIALELMRQEYGKPEILKVAPTVLVQFASFMKLHGRLGKTEMQEVLALMTQFDDEIRRKTLALKEM